jgi:hypothetical protein
VKLLLIVFRPSLNSFVVGKSSDLAAKGRAALLSRFLTGNDNPAWLVGEAESPADAVREIQLIANQLSEAKAKPQFFVVELHLASFPKGSEGRNGH